ncbi:MULTISPECIES: glycosyltransferase [unclassified Mesorhizobium]|uniref:glycosyltransferase n=1 Tax=unclassified Mesorhizobium TaxID=325217 RepID=UPI001FEF695D|nr:MULTISPECIES: glycosyltransferase [unclassified Mesorhizobium]
MGIFLGYTPRQLVPHEGITRLLGFIIRGAVNSGEIAVTVAGPGWLKTDIINLLDDAGVAPGSVDIVTTRGEPYLIKLWRIKTWFAPGGAKLKLKRKRKRFIALLVNGISLLVRWLSNSSILVFLTGAIFLGFLTVVLAMPIALSAIIVAGLYAAKRLLLRAKTNRFHKAKNWLLARWAYLLNAVGPLDTVRAAELNRLVRLLNRRRDVDVWYVPSMFWPETSKLLGKVVMAAPDIVFYEHPAQFISAGDQRALDRISLSIAGADRLITYSDYVKTTHIVNRHGVDPAHVSVIRHGFVDMASMERGDRTRQGALDILHQYTKTKEDSLPKYLSGFKFDDVRFLFYSSQVRPHKNIEALITVFERVLREHYRPVKLVFTGRIGNFQRIRDMIETRGLQRDVISLPAVPNYVLAALYRLAALSVTPTQFEGGFPFTFSEAYSVGTPSVMSRIPVVTELLKDQRLLDVMTFDPQDREEMLSKILWGLDNREALFKAQRPLFEALSARTWSKVADEYLDLMLSVGAK